MSNFTKINNKLSETTDILKQNIDIAIQRGEQLENLQDKSLELVNNAFKFKKLSKNLKYKFCKENIKIICGILILLIFITLIVIASICSNVKC